MEESVHQRKAGESRKKHAVAVEVRSLQKQPTEWKVAQLKAMVLYKKICTDEKLPTKRADLMQRYLLTKDRVSPPGTPIMLMVMSDVLLLLCIMTLFFFVSSMRSFELMKLCKVTLHVARSVST